MLVASKQLRTQSLLVASMEYWAARRGWNWLRQVAAAGSRTRGGGVNDVTSFLVAPSDQIPRKRKMNKILRALLGPLSVRHNAARHQEPAGLHGGSRGEGEGGVLPPHCAGLGGG